MITLVNPQTGEEISVPSTESRQLAILQLSGWVVQVGNVGTPHPRAGPPQPVHPPAAPLRVTTRAVTRPPEDSPSTTTIVVTSVLAVLFGYFIYRQTSN